MTASPGQEQADLDVAGSAPVALKSVVAQLAALFLGIAMLILGSGLLGTLLSVRGDVEGFRPEVIGLVMSAYFVGFIAGAYYGPLVVARSGHIRAFTAMASIVSAAALVHAMITDAWVWMALRVVTGFCFAALYLIAESWLNERATAHNRGRLLSIYMITSFAGMLGGQILLTAADPREFVLFGIASVALSLSLVPIAMTRTQAPVPTAAPRMRLRALLAVSPLGAIGCIASGICLGSFWAISPVFAREAGLDRVGVALFMAATVLGGLLAQWPVGRTSDQYDRRIVIVIASGLAAAFAAYIAAMPTSRIALLAAAIAYGAVLFPLYSLCLAHANDFSSPEDMLSLGSGLLLLYGIGAAVGPLLGGIVMGAVGAHGPYAASAIILLATAGYAVYRTRERPSPEEKESFVFAPRTTPAAFALDPRAETGEPELPFDEESQD